MTEDFIDIKLFLDLANLGEFFDIKIEANDFKIEDKLENADLISLLSDRRVTDDEAIDEYRGGWFGNSLLNISDKDWGSKLWTLYNKPLNNTTLRLWEQYTEDALAWQVQAGMITKVDCTAEIIENKLQFRVIKTLPDNLQKSTIYSIIWSR